MLIEYENDAASMTDIDCGVTESKPVYHDLQGRKVTGANLLRGIYLKTDKGKTSKVLVK